MTPIQLQSHLLPLNAFVAALFNIRTRYTSAVTFCLYHISSVAHDRRHRWNPIDSDPDLTLPLPAAGRPLRRYKRT